MRVAAWVLSATLLVTVSVTSALGAEPYEQRSAGMRFLLNVGAVAANLLPGVSALVAPTCLPGYIVCKLSFAAVSVIAAGESLAMSGGADKEQPAAILQRGFGGTWFLTARNVNGDVQAEPYPEAPPPASKGTEGGFEPPPL